MFKKIEIWILYLSIVVCIIFAIIFGILVRQELVGSKKLGFVSKYALIIAELPVNIKGIYSQIGNDGFAMLAKSNRHSKKPIFKKYINVERNELLVLSRFDGNLNKASVEIIDLNNFSVIHKYNPDIKLINDEAIKNNKKEFFRIKVDSKPNRFLLYHPLIDKNGNLISHSETGPIFKLDICSNIKWVNSKERFHHSNEIDHEGNYWAPSHMKPYSETMQKYRPGTGLLDDAITKISNEGKILYQKSIFDILIEGEIVNYNDLYVNNDPIHLNDIEPVVEDGPHWKKGDLFLSLRNLNTIILYRPSKNKVLKIIKGPFFMQHDVDIISNNEITIFNNNLIFSKNGPINKHIDILVYNFDSDEFYKKFSSSIIDNDIKTGAGGLSDFLNDGSIFIEEQNYGRLLLINNNKKLEWEYINKSKNNDVFQTTWSRIIKDESMIKILKNQIKNKKCQK